MTMSCVADAKATSSAPRPTISGADTGIARAEKDDRRHQRSCEATSQPRRRPSRAESHGTWSASTTGAHKNLIV